MLLHRWSFIGHHLHQPLPALKLEMIDARITESLIRYGKLYGQGTKRWLAFSGKKNIHKESTNDDEFLDRAMLGIRPMNVGMLF